MSEAALQGRWLARAAYFIVCIAIILFRLVPLETLPPVWGATELVGNTSEISIEGASRGRLWGGPDLLLLFTIALLIRRPDAVPPLLIGIVFLLSDMVFQRPPGLWAALVIILTEILRARAKSLWVVSFFVEWISVAAGIFIITVIYRFTLSLMLVPQAPGGLTFINMMITIGTYPVVVFLTYLVFGVERPAHGQVDSLGHRL